MANYINFYSLLRQHKCIHTHTHTCRRGMSSLGGNPGCRIHSDCVAMETGSSAGECRSSCVCTKAGAARKGVGVLLCNGGTALEPRRGMETEEKKEEEKKE